MAKLGKAPPAMRFQLFIQLHRKALENHPNSLLIRSSWVSSPDPQNAQIHSWCHHSIFPQELKSHVQPLQP